MTVNEAMVHLRKGTTPKALAQQLAKQITSTYGLQQSMCEAEIRDSVQSLVAACYHLLGTTKMRRCELRDALLPQLESVCRTMEEMTTDSNAPNDGQPVPDLRHPFDRELEKAFNNLMTEFVGFCAKVGIDPPGPRELDELTLAVGADVPSNPAKCDDCGTSTNDLITKSNHHGGMKTVCSDRNACHARGG